MVFSESRFPTDISYGSAWGPEYATEVVELDSGHEQRNSRWAQGRGRGNLAYGVKTPAQLDAVIAFFRARKGRLQGFRFQPFQDTHALGEPFGVGDAAQTVFQLAKTYTSGADTYLRNITKPVSGSETLYLDAVSTTAYTLDATTGLVTMDSPPGGGVILTWDGDFDIPVRFDTDVLSASWEQFELGSIDSIPIVEVRT